MSYITLLVTISIDMGEIILFVCLQVGAVISMDIEIEFGQLKSKNVN